MALAGLAPVSLSLNYDALSVPRNSVSTALRAMRVPGLPQQFWPSLPRLASSAMAGPMSHFCTQSHTFRGRWLSLGRQGVSQQEGHRQYHVRPSAIALGIRFHWRRSHLPHTGSTIQSSMMMRPHRDSQASWSWPNIRPYSSVPMGVVVIITASSRLSE